MQQYFLLKNDQIDTAALLEQAIKDPLTDALKLDTLYLLAKELFIQNNIKMLHHVLALLKNQNKEACLLYDADKVHLMESLLVQEELLSPITDDEKDKPPGKFNSYLESKSNQSNLYSNEFQKYTPNSYVSGLLDFGISTGNKQAITEAKEYNERSYIADIIITINEYDKSKLTSYQELD